MLKPNSKVTTNLIRARELIADEKNWCAGTFYNDGRICAVHALLRATGRVVWRDTLWSSEHKLLEQAARSHGYGKTPVMVNDEMGHAATMAMFDRAIELSLQDGG